MFSLSVPKWLKKHLFIGKNFADLTADELTDLKIRLGNFNSNQPDVSVVIPAWNEENNIFHALSSLASNKTDLKVEIVVINNNSTDNTQKVLDQLGVRSYFEIKQGIAHARQRGLETAKGKYHLCADSDTFYPPFWIETMVKPMIKDSSITGVYGRYAFIPPEGQGRFGLWLYERFTGVMVQIRKRNREFVNVLGFTMGFVTEVGRVTGGFKVNKERKFDNAAGSEYYTEESEDGTMALNLMKKGRLKLIRDKNSLVYTSPRRLLIEGSVWAAFTSRFKKHSSGMGEYITGKQT